MSVYEMAKKYYPGYWGKDRLKKLVQAGKLAAEQYREITGEPYEVTP